MLTKIVSGRESITYYHHHIATLLAAGAVALVYGKPVLPYLDVAALGLGLFLACGRLGCLMAGCCHGRPAESGIRYGATHCAEGFPGLLAGVPLIPVQALESVWVFGIVIAGAWSLQGGAAPGSALAAYTAAYAAGRFFLEFLRGDSARPYMVGFSEAQWTSAFLLSAVALASAAGILPQSVWRIAALAAVAGSMVLFTAVRRFGYAAFAPKQIEEVATAACRCLEEKRSEHDIVVARTSFGVKISAGRAPSGAGTVVHYSLSSERGNLSERAARSLSRWILRIRHGRSDARFVRGSRGVFHLLVDVQSPFPGAPV
jgi:hypothetical protein